MRMPFAKHTLSCWPRTLESSLWVKAFGVLGTSDPACAISIQNSAAIALLILGSYCRCSGEAILCSDRQRCCSYTRGGYHYRRYLVRRSEGYGGSGDAAREGYRRRGD